MVMGSPVSVMPFVGVELLGMMGRSSALPKPASNHGGFGGAAWTQSENDAPESGSNPWRCGDRPLGPSTRAPFPESLWVSTGDPEATTSQAVLKPAGSLPAPCEIGFRPDGGQPQSAGRGRSGLFRKESGQPRLSRLLCRGVFAEKP